MTDHAPELSPGPKGGIAVLQQIVDLKAELGPIAKLGVYEEEWRDGGGQKWNFRGRDDIVNGVSPLLHKHKLVATISGGPEGEPAITTTKARRANRHQDYTYRVTLLSSVDGSALSATVSSSAEGFRPQASGSAISYAEKYAYSVLLTIPFDDDRMEGDSNASNDHADETAPESVQQAGGRSGGQRRQRPVRPVRTARRDRSSDYDKWKALGWGHQGDHARFRGDLLTRLREVAEADGELIEAVKAALQDHAIVGAEGTKWAGKTLGWQAEIATGNDEPGYAMSSEGHLARFLPRSTLAVLAQAGFEMEPFEPGDEPGGSFGETYDIVAREYWQVGDLFEVTDMVKRMAQVDGTRYDLQTVRAKLVTDRDRFVPVGEDWKPIREETS